jgi:hypothetical protein
MTRKPRKRGPSIREQIRAELANTVFDAGTYGDDDAPAPEPESPPQPGRPTVYQWDRIMVEMCWHLSGKGPWGKLKRDEFIANMQAWCKQELKAAPSADELRRRIGLVRQRFSRR